MVSSLDGLKETVDENISGLEALQGSVQKDREDTLDLLAQGKTAQKVLNWVRSTDY